MNRDLTKFPDSPVAERSVVDAYRAGAVQGILYAMAFWAVPAEGVAAADADTLAAHAALQPGENESRLVDIFMYMLIEDLTAWRMTAACLTDSALESRLAFHAVLLMNAAAAKMYAPQDYLASEAARGPYAIILPPSSRSPAPVINLTLQAIEPVGWDAAAGRIGRYDSLDKLLLFFRKILAPSYVMAEVRRRLKALEATPPPARKSHGKRPWGQSTAGAGAGSGAGAGAGAAHESAASVPTHDAAPASAAPVKRARGDAAAKYAATAKR